jgi:putative tricarboxylic transport membrane protein
MSAPQDDGAQDGTVGTRWPELVVAAALMLLAGLVIADSLRVGTGWGDDGPRSGYFPFYIGLALFASAAWIAIAQLRRWSHAEVFAERAQLASVWAVLWPMALHVALIFVVGIYAASVVLIVWFMRRHGKHGWALTAAVAVGVPLLFFVVFERWFLVPLPKGPLEAMLGF